MTAKDFFLQVYDAQIELQSTRDRLETYRMTMYGVGGASGDITGIKAKGTHSDPVGKAVMRWDKLEREMQDAIDHYTKVIADAEALLDRMKPEYRRNRCAVARYKELLTRRYIKMEKWDDIQREMGFSDENGMYKLHVRALRLAEYYMYDGIVIQDNQVL